MFVSVACNEHDGDDDDDDACNNIRVWHLSPSEYQELLVIIEGQTNLEARNALGGQEWPAHSNHRLQINILQASWPAQLPLYVLIERSL